MPFWHENAATKAIAGKTDKGRGLIGRRRCKAEVGSAGPYKVDDLIRIALTYTETYVREALPKTLHHGHQDIARVHMRRRDGQSSVVSVGVIGPHTVDILNIAQHASRDLDDGASRFGKRRNPVALAHKQLGLQFLFQLANLARHAGLRSV